jgi:hypothetical protein
MLTFSFFFKEKQHYVKKSRIHNFFGLCANKLCTYLQKENFNFEKFYDKKLQNPTNQGCFGPWANELCTFEKNY